MRISNQEIQLLTSSITNRVPNAAVYLFGSRAYDDRRGGDIDLLVIGERKLEFEEKVDIKREFFNVFGEQKLDIVSFEQNEPSLFKDLVREEAIRLV